MAGYVEEVPTASDEQSPVSEAAVEAEAVAVVEETDPVVTGGSAATTNETKESGTIENAD